MIEPQELGTLIVVVARARNLPNKSRFGKQDPYCALTLGEEKRRTKPIKRGGQHPEWDEELRFPIAQDVEDMLAASVEANSLKGKDSALPPLPAEEGVVTPQSMAQKSRAGTKKKAGGRSMKVQCYADAPKEPELVGECIVPIDDALKKGEVDDWYELKYKDKYAGELYLELTFYSNAAPPVKRNVQRPGVLPATGPGAALATPPRHGMTTSVSGYNLYIPPYSQPGRTSSPAPGGIPHSASGPIPVAQHAPGIPHSNTFHDLGLPPRQSTGAPIPGQPDYPPGRIQNAQQDDFLAGQMGSVSLGQQSLGHSYQQRPGGTPAPPQAPATVGPGHHHRHSVATGAGNQAAPWGALLPQNQQPASHAPVQRPVSAGDVGGAWPTVDNRPNTAVPMPTRPLSAVGQPPVQSPPVQHHRPHSNSLTVPGSYAQTPPAGHQRHDSYGQPHVSQYTGQSDVARPTSPQSYYQQQQQQPQHQGYAPQQPAQQQPAYTNPPSQRLSSYGNVPAQQPQAGYTPPPNNRHSSYGQYQAPATPQPVPQPSYPPPQSQQPSYGQHQPPPQQDFPPVPPPPQQHQQGPQPPLSTSPAAYPSHLPPQAPRPTTPAAYPPYPPPHPPSPQPPHRDSYPGSQSPPSQAPYSPPVAHQAPTQPFAAPPETHTPPSASNASTTTGAYVPWYMQTQQHQQQPPVQSPPARHTPTPGASHHHHAHQSSISSAPAPPPRTGVGYYPSDELYAQQAQSQANHQRPQPQPTPAPQQYQGYQQPPAPQHQSSYPPAGPQSPPRQGSYPQAPPRPVSAAPSTSYNPPPPGPNPPAPSSVNPPAPNPPAPSSEAPWSSLQQQPYYGGQSSTSYYAQQGGDFRPTTTAPEGWDSVNGRQRAPSPLPPVGGGSTTNRDWRTYLHSIGNQGTPPPQGHPPNAESTPPAQLPPKRASGLPPLPQPPSQQGTPTRHPTNGSGEWYTPPPPAVPSSILPPGGYGSPQHQPQWR